METNQTNAPSETDAPSTEGVARYVELQKLVAGMAADFDKFYNGGNKAAGTRVRNAMQELKVFAQTVRTEVQTIKNEGKGSEGGEAEPAETPES